MGTLEYGSSSISPYSLPILLIFGSSIVIIGINKFDFADVIDNCNKLLLLIGIVLIFYIMLSFFLNINTLSNGSSIIKGNQYFLVFRGNIIREIDWDTYRYLRFAEYRLMTGHALIFSIIPTIFFSSKCKVS